MLWFQLEYFLEDGDELTFLAKDYLESLNNPRVPIDEGGIFWFQPAIQGNCLSEIGVYSASFAATYEVDENVFCSPTFLVPETTETFEYTGGPVLQVTTTSPINELAEPMSCVPINVTNVTNIDAPYSFLNVMSSTGGLIVTSITETTNSMDVAIPASQFGIYPINTTLEATTRSFEVCVNVTDCDPQMLEFSAGWDCENYPTTVEEATCADPSSISFITLIGDLDRTTY